MPAETFYCPGCKQQLTKSAQTYVLGEMSQAGGRGIFFGESPRNVTCPGCGSAIDAQKMIRGEYDRVPGSFGGAASTVTVLLWIVGWIYLSGYEDASWWLGGLLAIFPAYGAGWLTQKSVGKRKS